MELIVKEYGKMLKDGTRSGVHITGIPRAWMGKRVLVTLLAEGERKEEEHGQ